VTGDPGSAAVTEVADAPRGHPVPAAPSSRAARLVRGPLTLLRSSGFFDLLIAQMAPLAVSFGLTLVSAALLGPELRGVLTFLMTGALLCGALAYGSLHVPVVEALRNRDRTGLRHGLRLMWLLAGSLAAVGLALVVTGGAGRADVPSTVVTTGWALAGGAVVVIQLFTGRVLQGLARNREYQVTIVVQSLLYLLGAGSMLLVTRSPLPVFGAWYASVVLSVALTAVFLRRHLRETGPWQWSGSPWRGFLRSATANNVGSIGQMVMLRADVLVVAVVLGTTDAGIYGLALSLTELALIVPEVFALSVFASRARLDGARWRDELARSVRVDAVLVAVAAIAIAGAAVVLSLGPLAAYDGLVLLVLIVLPGVFVAGYSRIALSALQALGASSRVWMFGVLAIALAVGYVPAALIGGTVGTAVMSTIAYAVTGAFLHTSLRTALRGGVR
jgi:O-antigen/teichoic acid export membrane protein